MMAVFVPVLMAIVGMVLATASASLGQAEVRGQALATLWKMKGENERDLKLVREKLQHVDGLTRMEVFQLVLREAQLENDAKRPIDETRIWSYYKSGRVFTQWDGYRYEEIIDEGYLYHLPGDSKEVKAAWGIKKPEWEEWRAKNVVWYPLYPAVGYVVKTVTGLKTHNALTVVAWGCLIGASVVCFAVVRRQFFEVMSKGDIDAAAKADGAAMCTLALLLYGPASIFLYANYTESMFLLLLGLFLMMLQKRNWWGAAMVAAVASACRSQGVLFGPMLGVVYLLKEDRVPMQKKLLIVMGLGLVSEIGLASYVAYLGVKFQAPFAFMEAQRHWNVGLGVKQFLWAVDPRHAFENLYDYAVERPMSGRSPDWPHIWEAMCVIAPPVILVWGRKLLSLELLIVGWAFWLLPYVSNSLGASKAEDNCLYWMSMGRFMAVVIPLHMVVGTLMARARWVTIVMMAASAVGFVLLAYRFGMREWVG
jgi:hypothetical protein